MKKLVTSILAAVVMVQVLSVSAAPLQTIYIKSAINSSGTGMCMDVINGSTAIGTHVAQYPCHYGGSQRFQIEQFSLSPTSRAAIIRYAMDPNKCVGIPDIRYAYPYTNLYLVECTDSYGNARIPATFFLDSVDGRTVFRASRRSDQERSTCIDIPSGANTPSLWLQLYDCHNGGNQQWRIIF